MRDGGAQIFEDMSNPQSITHSISLSRLLRVDTAHEILCSIRLRTLAFVAANQLETNRIGIRVVKIQKDRLNIRIELPNLPLNLRPAHRKLLDIRALKPNANIREEHAPQERESARVRAREEMRGRARGALPEVLFARFAEDAEELEGVVRVEDRERFAVDGFAGSEDGGVDGGGGGGGGLGVGGWGRAGAEGELGDGVAGEEVAVDEEADFGGEGQEWEVGGGGGGKVGCRGLW